MFAGSKGFMDDVVKEKVSQFESNMLDYFRGPQKALRDELAAAKSFKGLDEKFVAALKTFKQSWKN
jgi:F0F1-type ATP synthase alpha subunit